MGFEINTNFRAYRQQTSDTTSGLACRNSKTIKNNLGKASLKFSLIDYMSNKEISKEEKEEALKLYDKLNKTSSINDKELVNEIDDFFQSKVIKIKTEVNPFKKKQSNFAY